MIERLRMLSFPLRFLIYVAGVALLFGVALGLGATAALVFEWKTGQAQTTPPGTTFSAGNPGESNASESTALERSTMETTSIEEALEEAGIEPSRDPENSNDKANKAPFVHKAKDKNSRGDYTYISESRINGDANAIVLASPTQVQKKTKVDSYQHHIGVWYEAGKQKWAIFNEDLAPVPEGATFNVVVPKASASFVHRAKSNNTSGAFTYLDDPLTNGKPDAILSATQNWNPGGGRGVYNDHPIGAVYEARRGKWAIYNKDGAPMPEGAAFNITVSPTARENLR